MGSDEQFSAGDVLIGVNTLMPWGFLLNLKLAKVKSFADDFRAFPPLIEAIVLHEALVVPSIEHAITFLSLSGNTSDDITLILKEFPDVEDDPAYNVYSSRINEYIQFLKAHFPSYRSRNRVNQVMMNMIKNDLLLTSSAHTRGLAVRLAYGEVIAYYLELVRDMNTRNNVYHGALDNILEEITGSVNDKLADLNSILPGNRFTLDVPLVFNYVLDRVRLKEDIIPVALDIRDSIEARAFRQQLTLLDEATKVGDDKSIIYIVEEIRNKIDTLGNKLSQPSVGLTVGFPLAIAFDPFEVLKRIKPKRKRQLMFIEQLYDAGIQAQSISRRLGRLL